MNVTNATNINNITNISSHKRTYNSPLIGVVKLDNEISLNLESAPVDPAEPGLGSFKVPDYFNNDPFKNNLV